MGERKYKSSSGRVMLASLLPIKIAIILGLGSWTGIACMNNIVDRFTNLYLLSNMLSMKLFKPSDPLGRGLLSRAWLNDKYTPFVLWVVVIVQAIISMLLLLAAVSLIYTSLNNSFYNVAIEITNVALFGFNSLWLAFLCGGLWFGYWIHMSHVQTTHLILLILGILTTLLVNL